jgi:hypothetical protein
MVASLCDQFILPDERHILARKRRQRKSASKSRMSVTATGLGRAAIQQRKRLRLEETREDERVRERVGRDQAARLAWLLEFAHRSHGEIRSMDDESLRQLNAEVGEFVRGFDRALGVLSPAWNDGIRDELCVLATFANKAIYEFVRARGVSFAPSSLQKRGDAALEKRVDQVSGKMVAYYDGPRPQVFVMRCAEAFEAEARRIAKCASPGCGRVFVKRKRAEYCSGRCSLRERMRNYRKNLKPKVRYEIRHAQYVKSVNRVDPERVIRSRGPRRSK